MIPYSERVDEGARYVCYLMATPGEAGLIKTYKDWITAAAAYKKLKPYQGIGRIEKRLERCLKYFFNYNLHDWFERDLKRDFFNEKTACFVLVAEKEEKQEIIGFATVDINRERADFGNGVIEPTKQGIRLADVLYEAGIYYIMDHEDAIKTLNMQVRINNIASIKAAERHGFKKLISAWFFEEYRLDITELRQQAENDDFSLDFQQ